MKKRFLIILLLFCSTLLSQDNSEIGMKISISNLPSNRIISLNLASPDNKYVWEYKSAGACSNFDITAKNWFSKPGIYKLSVLVEYKDTVRSKKEELEFDMSGKENGVNADICFTNRIQIDNGADFLYGIYLTKTNPWSDSVTIKEKWTPKSDGKPEYMVTNNSKRIVFGTNFLGELSGWVEKLDAGRWAVCERGKRICGMTAEKFSLYPGRSALLFEENFDRDIKPFTVGKYKYRAYYSFDEIVMGYKLSKEETVEKKVWNIYLLEKEFEIKDD
ncbi:MAG: hypothetical protein PHN88_09630 [Ignavibacteria bacterium]|nr:hypothetical protein [Ignavibacteria bacterium]